MLSLCGRCFPTSPELPIPRAGGLFREESVFRRPVLLPSPNQDDPSLLSGLTTIPSWGRMREQWHNGSHFEDLQKSTLWYVGSDLSLYSKEVDGVYPDLAASSPHPHPTCCARDIEFFYPKQNSLFPLFYLLKLEYTGSRSCPSLPLHNW